MRSGTATVTGGALLALALLLPGPAASAAPDKKPTAERTVAEKPAAVRKIGEKPTTEKAVNEKPAAGAPAKPGKGSGLGEFGSSKEPIKIDADRLDVFDKEGRAVFTGNVIAIQGDTTMKCTVMNVFYEQNRGANGEKAPSTGSMTSDSSVKKIDCKGPVTITTKTQTATGDRAEFDRTINKVFLTGNAALTDGPNVTRGERVAYDLDTGVANIEGGRVRALIVPGSDKDKPASGKQEAASPKKTVR